MLRIFFIAFVFINFPLLALSGDFSELKCTKYVGGRSSTPDPAAADYSARPGPQAGFKGGEEEGE